MSTVQAITDSDLSRLDPPDHDLIQRALGLDPNLPPAYNAELTYPRLKILMDVLGVNPVWGRAGSLIWRINYKGHVLIFSVTPDELPDGILTPEAMDRQWVECESVPEMLALMNDYAKGARDLDGQPPVIYPEDHPEESSIGFFAPAANRVWLLGTKQVFKDLKADNCGGWAQVNHLLQSNQGRIELSKRISVGALVSTQEFQAAWGQEPTPEDPRSPNEIFVDLASGQLAERYKARYLRPKGDA